MNGFKTRVGTAFSVFPWFWIAGLAFLVVRARVFLGYWPSPSQPDPKLLPFELHHFFLWIGFYLLFLFSLVAVVAYLFNSIFLRKKISRRPLWTFTAGWSFIVAMLLAPHAPFNWVAWFLD